MNCTEAKGNLADYSAGFLNEVQREQIQQHVASCAACRAHLAQLRKLDGLLAGDREVAGESLVRSVMAHVQAEPLRRMPTWVALLQDAGPLLAATGLLPVIFLAVWQYLGEHAAAAELPDLGSVLSAHPETVALLVPLALTAAGISWVMVRLGEALA